MAKTKVKTEARGTPVNPMTTTAWPGKGAPLPPEPVLGHAVVLERLVTHERRAAVAREACAGTRILEAAARDAAGLGWEFNPYAPDSRAERVGRGWEGWFTVGGKRLLVRVDLEAAEPSAAETEALAGEEDALSKLADAEAERDEAQAAGEQAEERVKELEDEVKQFESKVEAWSPVVEAVLLGDGPGTFAAAKAIKQEYRP